MKNTCSQPYEPATYWNDCAKEIFAPHGLGVTTFYYRIYRQYFVSVWGQDRQLISYPMKPAKYDALQMDRPALTALFLRMKTAALAELDLFA